MKKSGVYVISVIFVFICCSIAIWLGGCSCKGAQPGESAAEVKIRHLRQKNIEKEQLRQDVDKVLLTDQPSRLSDKRIR